MIITICPSLLLLLLGGVSAGYIPNEHWQCQRLGQFLPDLRDPCQYHVCDYGDRLQYDDYGQPLVFPRPFYCPPGLAVDMRIFSGFPITHSPCTEINPTCFGGPLPPAPPQQGYGYGQGDTHGEGGDTSQGYGPGGSPVQPPSPPAAGNGHAQGDNGNGNEVYEQGDNGNGDNGNGDDGNGDNGDGNDDYGFGNGDVDYGQGHAAEEGYEPDYEQSSFENDDNETDDYDDQKGVWLNVESYGQDGQGTEGAGGAATTGNDGNGQQQQEAKEPTGQTAKGTHSQGQQNTQQHVKPQGQQYTGEAVRQNTNHQQQHQNTWDPPKGSSVGQGQQYQKREPGRQMMNRQGQRNTWDPPRGNTFGQGQQYDRRLAGQPTNQQGQQNMY